MLPTPRFTCWARACARVLVHLTLKFPRRLRKRSDELRRAQKEEAFTSRFLQMWSFHDDP